MWLVHDCYLANDYQENSEKVIASALQCLEARLQYSSCLLHSAQNVLAYLQLNLAQEKSEIFAVLFLNSHYRLIAFEKLFRGSINIANIHPRIVVQKALEHNAAAVILAHNHPSGHCKPSSSDIEMTKRLKNILDIVDVDVLDHIIVAHRDCYSFAEHGLLSK